MSDQREIAYVELWRGTDLVDKVHYVDGAPERTAFTVWDDKPMKLGATRAIPMPETYIWRPDQPVPTPGTWIAVLDGGEWQPALWVLQVVSVDELIVMYPNGQLSTAYPYAVRVIANWPW